MQRPLTSNNEGERIADLCEYGILDTPPEEEYENIVRLAADICHTPIAAITFVDAERQWFKARHGLFFRQTSRKHSICAQTILQEDLFVVRDTHDVPAYRLFPHVAGGPMIRFYAGIPIHSYRGYRIGALCVMDIKPRQLDLHQRRELSALGRLVTQLLENKRLRDRLKDTTDMHNRLLELLVKDVKNPLNATGAFLNMLEGHGTALIPGPGFCTLAAEQFHRTLDVFNCLLEWRKVKELGHRRTWPSVEVHHLITDMMRSIKRDPAMRQFTLIDTHNTVVRGPLPDLELQFMWNLLIFWLSEMANDGTIDFHLLMIHGTRLKAAISLRSRSFLPELEKKIEKLRFSLPWSETIHCPTEDLYLMLAKDVLNDFNGDLQFHLIPDTLEVYMEIGLAHSKERSQIP